MTGQSVINRAMRLCGALASGESPTTTESTDALAILNDMLDEWNAQRLAIFQIQTNEFSLVGGTQTYTCGSGGTFNMARPAKIERIVLKVVTNPSFPLELPLKTYKDQEWASITLKTLQNTYPEGYWDDSAFPSRNINFWPIPSSALNVVIYSWAALTSFADLTTTYTFPPGYAKALAYNLAVEISGEFNAPMPPQVPAIAATSKASIKTMNLPEVLLTCDRAVQSPSTIPGVSRADFLGGRF